MALFTELSLEQARSLARRYGLDLASIEPLAAGSVNSNFRLTTGAGEVFFARVYEEQDAAGAEAELRLLEELAIAGVPTTVPLRPLAAADGSRGGALAHAGKPFAIYPWLEGRTLCQALVTRGHCRQVGEGLARLHLATPSLSSVPDGRFDPGALARRLDLIEGELGESEGHAALLEAAELIRGKLVLYQAQRDPSLPSGVIHGDLFRDNVLWSASAEQEQLAALIDFESASRGPFVYDLMVCIEAWCYGVEFEPALIGAMLEGYRSLRPLEPEELEAMTVEGAIAALRFATTRITDFSMRAAPGQPPVRDFRRFLGRLEALERGALDSVA